MKDFYKVLGVSADASFPQIRAAYRTLSKKYHPDLNQGDVQYEEKFKDILQAYSVLKDPYKRKKFDISLQNSQQKAENINKLRPPKPARKTSYYTSSEKKNMLRRDIYMSGGVILFLITIITVIVSLEKSFYLQQESYLEINQPKQELIFKDTLNLMQGFKPDSVSTSGAVIKPGSRQANQNSF